MSWLPKNLYPEGSGIDSKTIEDIVVQDIIKNEMTRREQLDLATALTVMLVAEAADETTTSYEYDDDEEYERRKIINKVEVEEEEEEDDEEEEEEEEEDEDEADEEDDEYADVYDSTEDGLYDAFDDVSSYGSLRFLVLDMPVENAEPEPITRKRALSREETLCPPSRNPAKRQKMDTSAVSEPPKPQASGTKEPASPSARPEWQQYGGKEIPKSLIPRIVRSALLGTPLHALHPEAQSFLMAINFDLPGSKELACAVIDMGLRFSKTATRSEYKIVFKELLESHGRISMYNSAHNNFEAQHKLFWDKVKKHTGKPVPPERLVEHQARKRRRIAESYARNRAIHAEENAKKLALQKKLKEQFAKKMSEGEAKKLPLDERVKKWLKEIVPVQKK
ncbi:hypothetical protein F25303_12977 [Fusarium sp. NRRL 25303]|nr:hypothetical protein F25303_12977 [Fusarium sp. NRRL 25303]